MSTQNQVLDEKVKSRIPQMKESLEVLGKALIFLAGICYGIGLIVVNIHLRQFGFYSLSLLQLNYVTAGIWALLPMMLPVFIAAAVMDAIYRKIREKEINLKFDKGSWREHWRQFSTNVIALVGAGIGAAISMVGLLGWFARILGLKTGWAWGRVGFAGALAGYALGVTIYRIKTKWPSDRRTYIRHLMRIFIAIIFFIAYISYFARELYKEIPASLGGGSPHSISLIVENESKPFLESAGLTFQTTSLKTEPVELILVTDKEYILRSKLTGQAVSIPHDNVKAVLFEKE